MRFNYRIKYRYRVSATFCLAVLSLLTLFTTGCGGGSGGDTTVPNTTIPQLRRAPEQITLRNGQSLRLDAYVWRDFTPGGSLDERRMIALLRVETTDQRPMPAGTRVEAAWVTDGEDVWNVAVVEESPLVPGSARLEVIGRNGPLWEPGTLVDVIVQIRDDQNIPHRLQDRQEPIDSPS
ncbi:MAG: hypothetical protein V4671_16945 [Armatimonadota bacterium]